ncbi:MAG: DNA alkylation repair protein [Halobacteriota archaeon]
MDPIIEQIRQELEALADPEIQKSSKRFFNEEVRCYGMKTATVIAMAKRYWKGVKNRPKPEIFALCEELYRSGYMEESFIVSQWAHALSGRYEREDLAVFQRWIDTYITNWASCDGLCNHTVGDFIEQYPECADELKRWTQSKNRWMRRASAVSLIVPAKHGRFLKESIEIAAHATYPSFGSSFSTFMSPSTSLSFRIFEIIFGASTSSIESPSKCVFHDQRILKYAALDFWRT